MKLDGKDLMFLKSIGYGNEELEQIERAAAVTQYRYNGEAVDGAKAVKLLGRNAYLKGVAKSALHFACDRLTEDNEIVSFDSRRAFKAS